MLCCSPSLRSFRRALPPLTFPLTPLVPFNFLLPKVRISRVGDLDGPLYRSVPAALPSAQQEITRLRHTGNHGVRSIARAGIPSSLALISLSF